MDTNRSSLIRLLGIILFALAVAVVAIYARGRGIDAALVIVPTVAAFAGIGSVALLAARLNDLDRAAARREEERAAAEHKRHEEWMHAVAALAAASYRGIDGPALSSRSIAPRSRREAPPVEIVPPPPRPPVDISADLPDLPDPPPAHPSPRAEHDTDPSALDPDIADDATVTWDRTKISSGGSGA